MKTTTKSCYKKFSVNILTIKIKIYETNRFFKTRGLSQIHSWFKNRCQSIHFLVQVIYIVFNITLGRSRRFLKQTAPLSGAVSESPAPQPKPLLSRHFTSIWHFNLVSSSLYLPCLLINANYWRRFSPWINYSSFLYKSYFPVYRLTLFIKSVSDILYTIPFPGQISNGIVDASIRFL